MPVHKILPFAQSYLANTLTTARLGIAGSVYFQSPLTGGRTFDTIFRSRSLTGIELWGAEMQSPGVPPPYPRIRDIPPPGERRRKLLRMFKLGLAESDDIAGELGEPSIDGREQLDVALQHDPDGDEERPP